MRGRAEDPRGRVALTGVTRRADRNTRHHHRTEIGPNSKILEAGSAGTSVFRYSGAERAAEMYLALAREVVERG